MNTLKKQQGMSIRELVLYVQKNHKKTVREQTLYRWIYRGRRKRDGEVRYLRSFQLMGEHTPHRVTKTEIDAFLSWLLKAPLPACSERT